MRRQLLIRGHTSQGHVWPYCIVAPQAAGAGVLSMLDGREQMLIQQIETFLSSKGIRFTKHEMANDNDHIDASYDLNNISVRKRDI